MHRLCKYDTNISASYLDMEVTWPETQGIRLYKHSKIITDIKWPYEPLLILKSALILLLRAWDHSDHSRIKQMENKEIMAIPAQHTPHMCARTHRSFKNKINIKQGTMAGHIQMKPQRERERVGGAKKERANNTNFQSWGNKIRPLRLTKQSSCRGKKDWNAS